MLSRRGRRPDRVQIQLVRMHPHQAGEEIQAIRRFLFSFVENSTVGIKGSNDVRVGVRKRALRIRPQQESKWSLGESSRDERRK